MSAPAIVEHIQPDGLHHNPAFTNVVTVSGPARTVYVGGQNAVDESGRIVGAGDLAAQTAQVFRNLEIALGSAGAKLEHVIKWTVYVKEGEPLEAGFAVFQEVWGRRPNPPLITVAVVQALANPEFLVELEAVAVVPDESAAA